MLAEPGALLSSQPLGTGGVLSKVPKRYYTEENRRKAFHQKQRLPAREPSNTTWTQKQATQRAAENLRQRDPDHDRGDCSRPVRRRKPSVEVVDESGKEAGFRDAEEKSGSVKLGRASHPKHCTGDRTPRDRNAREPLLRAHTGEDQVAR